ncbi:MAG: DUF445 domain-containing protein [Chloroflexi bacterium]|nr:DUF445 domain-containing protein [Chloroflexota bacterium]
MSLAPNSTGASTPNAKKTKSGVRLRDGEWSGTLPYEDFPQFREMPEDEVVNLQTPEAGQYLWPSLGRVVDRQTIEISQTRKRGLQRMRYCAFALLVLMGMVFALADTQMDQHPWLTFVRAFAEAAMVGALADWFAVTALFRRPLGLPIPHTNIIQERKDEIGRSLAAFIKNNFLTPQNLDHRLAGIDLAGEIGRWLENPRKTEELSLVCRAVLAAIDNGNGALGEFLRHRFRELLDGADVSIWMARVLNRLVSDGHTTALVGRFVSFALQWYDEEKEAHYRREVKRKSAYGTRTIAGKVFDKASKELRKIVAELQEDATFRKELNDRLKLWAWKLEHEKATRERMEAHKQEFLEDPEVKEAMASLGAELEERLRQGLRTEGASAPPMAEEINKVLARLGRLLAERPDVRHMVNGQLKAAIRGLVARYGDGLVGGISITVASWDARQASDRIELHIGRDLQWIRINGTIMGGLVGLGIHVVHQAVA